MLTFRFAFLVPTVNKAPVYAPVDVCKADGVTLIPAAEANSGQSGCNGGNNFMCSCMQPFDDTSDSTLALGFAAFTTGQESDTDCACYYAEFAHDGQGKPIKRNKLIFQVTNTGGDVQSQNIDFQIPGGGLGAFPQGCPKQWGVAASLWGDQYGGVKTASQCKNLPGPLQEGCEWRFSDWGDNPVLKGSPKRVRCPKSLIDRSGCQRKDDNTASAYSGRISSENAAAPAQHKRDRSVCLAGGKKQGYSAGGVAGTGGTVDGDQGKPQGYSPESAGNGKDTGVGSGSGSNPPHSGGDSGSAQPPASGDGGQGGNGPLTSPSRGHKKCRSSH
ncbi:glycoside hydrolase [Pseudozyma hubeiensis SY62]|uniref:cellulase n=1 Tax=Pseudozyma hubeiensis (strain SY62) TaxID=1305764 RepID=R9P9S1_PSEHS|nr:glycoside hydrolase [Pseudozyma hubeiensis SY62]GAC98121.1 glycoside hydrolase [Pseudozyma hubeiensis SY62]